MKGGKGSRVPQGLDWLSGTGVSTALGNVHRPKLFPTKPPPLGCGATRSEIYSDVTIAGQPNERTNERTRKDRATQPMDHGRLRWAITWFVWCMSMLLWELIGRKGCGGFFWKGAKTSGQLHRACAQQVQHVSFRLKPFQAITTKFSGILMDSFSVNF